MRKSTLFASGQVGRAFEAVQLFQQRFVPREFLRPRFCGVIREQPIEAMIAQFRRALGMHAQTALDVFARQLLEFVIRWSGAGIQGEGEQEKRDEVFHGQLTYEIASAFTGLSRARK